MVRCQESRDPEEGVNDKISRKYDAEERALDPLLDSFQILNRAFQCVIVRVSKNYQNAGKYAEAVHDLKFPISLLSQGSAQLAYVFYE